MKAVELDIKRWGNCLYIRLPMGIAKAAHLRAGQRVSVAVEDGRVVIAPMAKAPLTQGQRLARFDPARHGGEVMATAERVGAERRAGLRNP